MDDDRKQFLNFLKKNKVKISTKFLLSYFTLTNQPFVSITDLIMWLGISRDTAIKTLYKSYKLNEDYLEILQGEEIEITNKEYITPFYN
jgi:hypothetical protein